MANFVTGLRFVFSLLLLCCAPFSKVFFLFYILAGVTDMTDGTIARKTRTASKFGAKLDAAADFVFFIICALKLLPVLRFPPVIWLWAALIFALKLMSAAICFSRFRELPAVHSVLNKIAGVFLFFLPFALRSESANAALYAACAFSTAASLHEMYFVIKGK